VLSYSSAAQHYDLRIKSVLAQDAGVYTCVDSAGMGQRANATLSVRAQVLTTLEQRLTTDSTAASSMSRHTLSTRHSGKDYSTTRLGIKTV